VEIAPGTRILSRFRYSLVATVVLLGAFSLTIYQWLNFSRRSELYSYTIIIPLVTLYLLAIKRRAFIIDGPPAPRALTFGILGAGVVAAALFVVAVAGGFQLAPQNFIALGMLALVLLMAGTWAVPMTSAQLRTAAFPLVFLLFTVPFPSAVEHGLEAFLQRGSAPPAHWFFQLAGTTVYRQDLVFQLPNITLQVAPECSGIRSTVVLFITSLLAGHLFLRSPTKRVILTAFVLPLALIRNGFRIFTIGELCVHLGPHMIESAIHRHGGPLFFALSLVPFSALLFILVRMERTRNAAKRPI
jgi:exosortase C (VPDSG-CTERM-specific)